MAKKGLTVELPGDLVESLDRLAGRTGRKKNLLVGACLSDFLGSDERKQEDIVKKYLNGQKQ